MIKSLCLVAIILTFFISACRALAAAPVDGACGKVNGIISSTAPEKGLLCASGAPSALQGSGPWTWNCLGTNGGSDAFCLVPTNFTEFIPTSAQDASYNAATDTQRSFTAPNDQTVNVLVKGPQGITAATTYHAPVMGTGSAPSDADDYFPWIINQAVAGGFHRILVPQANYTFSGSVMVQQNPVCSQASNINYASGCSQWTIGNVNGNQCPAGVNLCYPEIVYLKDMEIDFQNSVLNFSIPSNGIQINNANRIRLKNFTIDYPNVPMSALGTIIVDPKDAKHHALAIDPEYPVLPNTQFYPVNNPYPQLQAVNTWDNGSNPSYMAGTGSLDIGHFDMAAMNNNPVDEEYFMFNAPGSSTTPPFPTFVGAQGAYPQVYTCNPSAYGVTGAVDCAFGPAGAGTSYCNDFYSGYASLDCFPVGKRVVVRYFTYNGWAISVGDSNDVDIENMTMYAGPGLAIALNNGGYRGFRLANSVITRTGNRPVSVVGDIVHIGALQADLIVENNIIAYQGDDGINNDSIVSTIANPNNSSQKASVNAEGTSVTIPNTVNNCSDPNLGDGVAATDRVVFFNSNLTYQDTGTVASLNAPCVTTGNITPWQLNLDQCASGKCSTNLPKMNNSWEYIDLNKISAARYFISGNTFWYNRGHGALLSAPDGLVANNIFAGDTGGNIAFDETANSGNQGGFGSSNLQIAYNTMDVPGVNDAIEGSVWLSNGFSTAAVFHHLLINNNVIKDVGGPAIWISSAERVNIKNTVINNADMNPSLSNPSSGNSIEMSNVSGYDICGTVLSGTSGKINAVHQTTCATNPPEVSGVCGEANNTPSSLMPMSGLCLSGRPSMPQWSTTQWTWKCQGGNNGATSSCSAPIPHLNGACGEANGVAVSYMPTTGLCAAGWATVPKALSTGSAGPSVSSSSSSWQWTCLGQGGGKTASCRALD